LCNTAILNKQVIFLKKEIAMKCSFCGKPKEDVKQLVAGKKQSVRLESKDGADVEVNISIEAVICNECVASCAKEMLTAN
jgi:hypothetical protein